LFEVLIQLAEGALWRSIVNVQLRQSVGIVHNFWAEVLFKHRVDSPDVSVISNTPSVVDLSDDVVQGLVGDIWLLCQEEEQLHVGALEVRIHPFITFVPTNSAILSSLEDSGVEVS
jgi:hypothetical protein